MTLFKLFIGVINFELTQHIRPRYINVTDRQIDRQMQDSNTALALHALRGKNSRTPMCVHCRECRE